MRAHVVRAAPRAGVARVVIHGIRLVVGLPPPGHLPQRHQCLPPQHGRVPCRPQCGKTPSWRAVQRALRGYFVHPTTRARVRTSYGVSVGAQNISPQSMERRGQAICTHASTPSNRASFGGEISDSSTVVKGRPARISTRCRCSRMRGLPCGCCVGFRGRCRVEGSNTHAGTVAGRST